MCHGSRLDAQTQLDPSTGAFVGTATVDAIGLSFSADGTAALLPDGSTAHTIDPVPDGIPISITTDGTGLPEGRDGNLATFALRSVLYVDSPLDGVLRALPGMTIDPSTGPATWRER